MPAMMGFTGGTDVQRSLNLSDNKCINLYPTLNDKGDIAAFYATPGLTLYASIPAAVIGNGIYTASNGRCFLAAGATLYEITTGGVLTSRGTITGAVTARFSDNGLQLIMVNGTDGWLLTFATNALVKISVHQAAFTVTIATPAVFTSATHGLIAGTRITLGTTGALPTGLLTSTKYYVLAAGLTANDFRLSLTDGGAAINTSGVQSGIHTFTTVGFGFPEGTKTVSYMNGRFICCQPNSQNFYVSEVLDGFTWDALNVQTVDSNPDRVIGEIVSHNELIVFCELSGETFYDSGTIPSPFVRNVSGVFEVGCTAPYSIAKIDNSVMWLGKSTTGQGIVYRLQGYTPMRMSTFSIEYAIQQMTDITDAIAFTYQQDGHHFYVITFPTGGRTFCFDANTQLWHERAGFTAGVFVQWEARGYGFFDNKHLVYDYLEGKIYSLNLSAFTDNGVTRKWVRSWRAPASDMKRVCHNKLTLEAEMGVGLTGGAEPQVMLKYSNDGGHTWSADNWRDLGIGSTGQYSRRAFWHRLGMTTGQPRLYELSGTAPVKTVLLNAYLE